MEFEQITKKIIASAYSVYNKMGFGFLESVYEKCLQIELAKHGLKVESQKSITVTYEDQVVGEFKADLLVEEQIIIELKSVRNVTMIHEAQLVNYLVATDKPVGLILNFGEQKVDVRRKVRDLNQYCDQ